MLRVLSEPRRKPGMGSTRLGWTIILTVGLVAWGLIGLTYWLVTR